MADPQHCLEQAENIGESCVGVVRMLFQDRVLARLRAVQGILKLANKYSKKRLEVRARQAVEQKLPHMDFLALLLGDEIARRDQSKFAQRQRRAGLHPQKTLETFDFTFNNTGEQYKIQNLSTCLFFDEKAPVLLMGPCGTGKSHLAHALGHQAIRRGHDVLFPTMRKYLPCWLPHGQAALTPEN